MTPVTPFGPPTEAVSGDTLAFRYSHPSFPVADLWVLSAALVSVSSATQTPLSWSSGFVTNDGATWTVTLPSTTTDDFAAGAYTLTLYATLSGARYTMYSGQLLMRANAAAQTGAGVAVSHAEEMWAAIKAALEGRVVADVESYQIAGRALNRIPMDELQKLEKRYAERVWRERNPGKALPGRLVTFWRTL